MGPSADSGKHNMGESLQDNEIQMQVAILLFANIVTREHAQLMPHLEFELRESIAPSRGQP